MAENRTKPAAPATEPDDDSLTIKRVALLLGVIPKTIINYRLWSHGEGRYAEHPFPAPSGYVNRSPWWAAGRADEIRAWATSRKGQGAGGGRPRSQVAA
jgi:hypothetical protein